MRVLVAVQGIEAVRKDKDKTMAERQYAKRVMHALHVLQVLVDRGEDAYVLVKEYKGMGLWEAENLAAQAGPLLAPRLLGTGPRQGPWRFFLRRQYATDNVSEVAMLRRSIEAGLDAADDIRVVFVASEAQSAVVELLCERVFSAEACTHNVRPCATGLPSSSPGSGLRWVSTTLASSGEVCYVCRDDLLSRAGTPMGGEYPDTAQQRDPSVCDCVDVVDGAVGEQGGIDAFMEARTTAQAKEGLTAAAAADYEAAWPPRPEPLVTVGGSRPRHFVIVLGTRDEVAFGNRVAHGLRVLSHALARGHDARGLFRAFSERHFWSQARVRWAAGALASRLPLGESEEDPWRFFLHGCYAYDTWMEAVMCLYALQQVREPGERVFLTVVTSEVHCERADWIFGNVFRHCSAWVQPEPLALTDIVLQRSYMPEFVSSHLASSQEATAERADRVLQEQKLYVRSFHALAHGGPSTAFWLAALALFDNPQRRGQWPSGGRNQCRLSVHCTSSAADREEPVKLTAAQLRDALGFPEGHPLWEFSSFAVQVAVPEAAADAAEAAKAAEAAEAAEVDVADVAEEKRRVLRLARPGSGSSSRRLLAKGQS